VDADCHFHPDFFHLWSIPMTDIKLTKRQVQILNLLKDGASNMDISLLLGISEHTVKVHVWRLFRRINVKNRGGAVAWWITVGGGAGETPEQAFERGRQVGRQEILDNISSMSGKPE
jgi:DNA-binding CsgD family transcriptional regulator